MSDREDLRPIDAAISRLRQHYTPAAGRPSEDAEDQSRLPDDELSDVVPAEELFWPPPGLSAIHGDIPRLAFELTLGSALLLAAFASDGRSASVVLSIAFVLLCVFFARVRQLLWHTHNAVDAGYPRTLIWQVAADRRSELGMIVQGKGAYTGITRAEVTRIAQLRVSSAMLQLFAALWVPLVFPWIVILGFTGVFNDFFVWATLLAPPLAFLIAAVRFRLTELKLRRKYREPASLRHELTTQVAGWNVLFARLGIPRSKARSTVEFRLAMGAVWLAAFFLLIPLALAGVMNIIPRLVGTGAPSDVATYRAAALMAFDEYRLPADSSITPAAAGRALQAIMLMGDGDDSPMMQRADVRYAPVFPNQQFTRDTNPESWAEQLFRAMSTGLTPAQRALVDSAAAHPANAAIARIARASAIDIAGTRWHLGIADTTPLHQLPISSLRPLRQIAQAHIARAAVQMQRGETARADTTLREIISAGQVLRGSPSPLDAALGGQLVPMGARALASFYETTGRAADATRIRGALQTVDRAVNAFSSRRLKTVDEMREYVLRPTNPPALRWETFVMLQTAAPCLSFKSAVFGPDAAHQEWVRRARAALVRTPADSTYFALVQKGMAEKTVQREPRCSIATMREYRALVFGY